MTLITPLPFDVIFEVVIPDRGERKTGFYIGLNIQGRHPFVGPDHKSVSDFGGLDVQKRILPGKAVVSAVGQEGSHPEQARSRAFLDIVS